MYSSFPIYKVALGYVSRVEKLPKALIPWRMPVGRDRKWDNSRLWSIGPLPWTADLSKGEAVASSCVWGTDRGG